MKISRSGNLQFIPASHENQKNPGVYKKVLFKKGDIARGVVEMVNWAKLPKGKSFNLHFHEDMEEVFIMISGKVCAQVGNETVLLQTGDALVVPIKTPHAFKNCGNTDAEYIVFGVSKNKGGKTIVIDEN